MRYGYVRVSTKEQHEDRQLAAMQTAGVNERQIFVDKLSGKDFERPNYKKLKRRLKEGDVLFVKSIDRLGRNYNEILNEWRIITKDIKACIVVIDMPLLDTRKKEHDLTGVFISDLVLQILSYVAETERDNIRKRQAEGIAVARAKGIHLGRPARPKPMSFYEIFNKQQSGEISRTKAGQLLGVSRTTYTRWIQDTEAKISYDCNKNIEIENLV